MEFKRSNGNLLSGPESWIRENLALCPFCKRAPEWETATEFTVGAKRYYFRCPLCLAVLSVLASEAIPVPGSVGAVANPLTFLVRIESTGKRGELTHFQGTAHSLTELRVWARGTL
jgi:hypothetical protein